MKYIATTLIQLLATLILANLCFLLIPRPLKTMIRLTLKPVIFTTKILGKTTYATTKHVVKFSNKKLRAYYKEYLETKEQPVGHKKAVGETNVIPFPTQHRPSKKK